jgi:hypothetical protein
MVTQLRQKLSLLNHPNLIFWFCFLILNGLLFLPLYLLNRETTTFLPFPSADPAGTIKQLMLWRNNLDPFRLNAEVLLLVVLWVHGGWLRKFAGRYWFRWFFGVFYFVALGYYLYESIMLSLYQVDPVFYSHYQLAIDGLQMVARHLQVPLEIYITGVLVLVVGTIVVGILIRAMLDSHVVEQLSLGSRIGLDLIALLVIVSVFTYQETLASPKMVVSSFVYKLEQNIADSIEVYQRVHTFGDVVAQNAYNYSGYHLLHKPNIYLIFVESYGSVLYKRPDYREAYTALLSQLQDELQEAGWYTASTLSEAPTWGGGSWMSYTTTLFGLRIDTHPQFLSLLDQYQSEVYPDLGHYLETQGYRYVRLSSLSVELGEEQWREYKNFYGMDEWLGYSDLHYHGLEYGWGPAPPDQYALNFAHDTIRGESAQPFFLFFITQNSHYPWIPLPEIVDDWRTLNEIGVNIQLPAPNPMIPHQIKRKNYFDSINYELRFLTDYILKVGNEESIFILIGDHQPQQVSRRDDGFDTPVHIISQDTAFVDAFLEYGFVRGLAIQDIAPTIRHEGFYSMFVRVLLTQYGQGIKALPEYLPGGVVLEDSTTTGQS